MERSAVKVKKPALMSPRESSGGMKLRRVVAIELMKTALESHFCGL
jgi:hypothetical protein